VTPLDILRATGLVALIVVACMAVWAIREAVKTMRAARAASESLARTSDEIRERAVPLLDKFDVTVDAVNVELLRVDAIISTVEEATERVSTASGTISGMVNAPGEIVNDVIGRVRRAWKDRRHDESARSRGESDDRTESESDSDAADAPAS